MRRYTPDVTTPEGEEVEMDDDTLEPLPAVLDLGDVLEEVLALAIPEFPRADGADEIDLTAAPEGAEPLTDEASSPSRGLPRCGRR